MTSIMYSVRFRTVGMEPKVPRYPGSYHLDTMDEASFELAESLGLASVVRPSWMAKSFDMKGPICLRRSLF